MSLQIKLPPSTPTTGVKEGGIKPITEGKTMDVIPDQNANSTGGFWSFLDDVGTSISAGLSQFADIAVQRELADFIGGSETTVDSRGNPDDQPGGEAVKTNSDIPFYQRYQKELMIGSGVIVVGALLFFATRGKK